MRWIESYDWPLLDRYIVLRKYGSWYLSPEELQPVAREVAEAYWGRLGEAALFGRESAYWEHHRHGLETVGERLGVRVLAVPVTRAVFSAAVHPRWAFARLWESRKRRR